MPCTGKYQNLVTNGLGGTLDNPCGLYCNNNDVNAWNVTAADLFAKVRAAWNATAPLFLIPKETRDFITALERDYCDADEYGVCVKYNLPQASIFDISANMQAALVISKWCSRAACALELLDQARGDEGLPTEMPPTPPPSAGLGGIVDGVIKVAGFAVGAWLVVQLLRR